MTPILPGNDSRSDISRMHISRGLRITVVLVLYTVAFIALDLLTRSFQIYPNVVAWYPPQGISFALLLTFGWEFAPSLVITSLFSSFFIYKVVLPPGFIFLWAIVVAAAYGVVSAVLHRRFNFDPQLRSVRDVVKLLFATAIVSAVLSVVSISSDVGGNAASTSKFIELFIWWIGESVGVLVVTPFLLIYVMPVAKQFIAGDLVFSGRAVHLPSLQKNTLIRALSVVVVLYLAFGVPALQDFQPIYLIAIPLIWIALDQGIRGASAGIMMVNFAATYSIWLFHLDLTRLGAIQLLMFVLATASLLIGAIRTEQLQASAESDKSEKYFRALVKNSLEEVSLVNADGTLIFESPARHPPLGYSPGTFVGHKILELFHPDDQEMAAQLLDQVIRQPGIHKQAAFRLRRSDGSWRWMEGIVTNLLDDPAVQAIVINYRDITERKHAEDGIKTRTDELQTLYTFSRDLARAETLEQILDLANRHLVDSVRITFARVALVEGDVLAIRSAYPIRVLERDLFSGDQMPISQLNYCQRVMKQNDPIILRARDPELDDIERNALLLDFAQCLCLIPLRSSSLDAESDHILGLLMLGEARNEDREPFTSAKLRMAQSIGDQTSVAIRRMLLQEQTKRRLQHLTALREIDQAITSSFGLGLSMDTVLTQVVDQLHVDAAAIWLFRPDSELLEFSAGHGFNTKIFEQAEPLQMGEGFAGRAIVERETIYLSNMMAFQNNPTFKSAMDAESFVSYYAVPLISREDIMGVMEVFLRTPLHPDQEWLNFLNTLAGQAAIAIDNATLIDNLIRSNDQLIEAYDATIVGWSAALDLRDKETEGHTQRVTAMTVRLAEAMGYAKQDLVHVRRGALLHDIGKIGVPDRILHKPDKLTEDEWVIMRKHPRYAYEMLSAIQYLHDALDIPYCHHEKWDGTGYPRGLKGDEIPLAARVFAIVDVWDALVSDRPYRLGWPNRKIVRKLQSLSGSHFDPQVVDAFLSLLTRVS